MSLSCLPALNLGAFPPGIGISSFVLGFLPTRGLRSVTSNVPKPTN